MTIPIVPKLLRAHLSDLAENDARIDGRSQSVSYTHLRAHET